MTRRASQNLGGVGPQDAADSGGTPARSGAPCRAPDHHGRRSSTQCIAPLGLSVSDGVSRSSGVHTMLRGLARSAGLGWPRRIGEAGCSRPSNLNPAEPGPAVFRDLAMRRRRCCETSPAQACPSPSHTWPARIVARRGHRSTAANGLARGKGQLNAAAYPGNGHRRRVVDHARPQASAQAAPALLLQNAQHGL